MLDQDLDRIEQHANSATPGGAQSGEWVAIALSRGYKGLKAAIPVMAKGGFGAGMRRWSTCAEAQHAAYADSAVRVFGAVIINLANGRTITIPPCRSNKP